MIRTCILLLLLHPVVVVCQQAPTSTPQTISSAPEEIIVTGTFEPIPLSEANRSVLSLDTQQEPFYNAVIDYLHLDSSIDLRERGVDGIVERLLLSIKGEH